jgi:hypothetical protein
MVKNAEQTGEQEPVFLASESRRPRQRISKGLWVKKRSDPFWNTSEIEVEPMRLRN